MKRADSRLRTIWRIYRTLEQAMGPQHWWPAESPFEVVVGAYLTQNTAWKNVELAIGSLRKANALSISGIRDTPVGDLEQLIRPAGYFRQKAGRLKLFVAHLDARHGGSLEAMFRQPTGQLRTELLELPGIGPETADSILLYAASHEVFVVDSYTRRIFERHGLTGAASEYDEIRLTIQEALREGRGGSEVPGHNRPQQGTRLTPILAVHLPSIASTMDRTELSRRYNEFHALIVQTAKHYCLKGVPKCESCPLGGLMRVSNRDKT